jgi:hexosaminidase
VLIPPLIPTVAQFHFGAETDAFLFDALTPLVIGTGASEDTLFAARQLQSAVGEALGLRLPLRKAAAATAGVVLRLSDGDEGSHESYAIDISNSRIELSAPGEAGLFYAVQTLKQLLRSYGRRIPSLRITDQPVLAHRGLMLDVSRGKVPTLSTLFALVDGLSTYKYNQLQLYVEHTFDFPSHPDIGAGCDPLTADDMLALDAYCRARHIELVPNLQSFGHHRHMLSLPAYRELDEVGWGWSLTPARSETYELLDQLYADFLPAFSSGWLNVDCDETYDLGAGQSKARAAEVGKGRLYLEHLLRLRELAAKYGRRIMLWADVLHHYPELAPDLPEDVLLLDWEYEAADRYPTAFALSKFGREFWVCPGTSSWNTLFPRLENAVVNIRNYVRDGLQAGATGMLLTDWGDYGHYLPLALSWYQYVFGAATAWTGAETTVGDFDPAFAYLHLGRPAGDVSVEAMHRLARAVTAPSIGSPNRSALALVLFENPLSGRAAASIAPEALAEVQSAVVSALAAWAGLADAVARQEYGFVARLVGFAAEKAAMCQAARRTLAELASATRGAEGVSRLEAVIAAFGAARLRARALRMEFETSWLRHARRAEIDRTLEHFDAMDRGYGEALAWFAGQRSAYAAGGALDAELRTYTPESMPLLWEQGERAQRELAEIVGG